MPPSPSPTHKLLHPPSCASSVLSLPRCASCRIFSSPPVELFTSFRCLGILLQKVDDKVYVRDKLDLMYKQANIAIPTNRLGLAKGIGLIAAFHLDVVLEKLKEILDNGQSILQRLLSFFTDRTKLENSDDIHAALALMYGYAAKYAPSIVIKARIDVLVVHSVAWNCIGTKLASGSVDQTARIWLIEPHGHETISFKSMSSKGSTKRRMKYLMKL